MLKNTTLLLFLLGTCLQTVLGQPLRFRVQKVSSELYEAVGAFDVNLDGKVDLVSGGYWYEGPAFVKKHTVLAVKRYDEHYDDFSAIPLDVNGDGYTDVISGGWWGGNIRWRQNPGKEHKEWVENVIGVTGNVETTRASDIDGDGVVEIAPNNPQKTFRFFRLILDADRKGTGKFTEHVITEAKQGHGLGFGDINGDGRGDFVFSTGWLEAPKKPFVDKWIWHDGLNMGKASVPILVIDLNGDGLNDLIAGQGHDYGLDWYEQTKKGAWKKHPIDPNNSQFHELVWADLHGNGKPVLVTGKRFRAHNDGDPGAHDDYGLYYYQWNGESFAKQIIAYGPILGKGTGIQMAISDLNSDGKLDIAVAGKDGLHVYYNEGISE
jgi:hypothetical protein